MWFESVLLTPDQEQSGEAHKVARKPESEIRRANVVEPSSGDVKTER
jgi:hypothetical protein